MTSDASGPQVRPKPDRTALFGAVCPARGTGAGLVLPFANAAMMTLHVRTQRFAGTFEPRGSPDPAEISAQVTPGAHAVVVLDGAGWHQQGGRPRVPDNLALPHVPPYSPELNPVENVWAWLRGNKLSRVFDGYDAIVSACADAWNSLIAAPERITSIATPHRAQVN